jgi:hypothetical protein
MRRTWTIHCHPEWCYWECITEEVGTAPRSVRSVNFKNRVEATLDATRHGLDPDSSDDIIIRRNYQS